MPEQAGRYIIHFSDIPAERPRMPELEVAERIQSFDEVELGFSREAAQQEARRCLSCRRCLGCALCLAVCKPKAIVFEQQDEIIDLSIDDVIISGSADQQMPLKKGEFGYRQYANIVSGLEFEAILSESGPYGGMVLRPFDGRIPQKIAFIIAENSADCTGGVLRQATRTLQKVQDAVITIFAPQAGPAADMTPGPQIIFKKSAVTDVMQEATGGNLRIAYSENGSTKEETFCMAVAVRATEPSRRIQELCSKFGKKPL
jgi:ferredoxin